MNEREIDSRSFIIICFGIILDEGIDINRAEFGQTDQSLINSLSVRSWAENWLEISVS